jgi:hypothetical protein
VKILTTKKMKKLTKNLFSVLRDSYPVLTEEELLLVVGGNTCVFHCFSYVTNVSWQSHVIAAVSAGYNPYDSGGISHSDISAVGNLAGLSVSEITSSTSFTFNNSTEKTSTGGTVMMVFNYGNKDHAVIVTGISSNGTISYYDPANKCSGTRSKGSYSTLYSMSASSNTSY